MKVMVIVKATKSSEAGQMPSELLLMEMGKYNEELVKAGIMKAGEGLKPTSQAKRVRFHGQDRTVTDGPFAETKELIAGFWIWEVASMQEAIDWVKRCPNPMLEDSDIDIRPLFGIEDFAESDPTEEIRNQEKQLSQQITMNEATVGPYLFFAGRCEEALAFYEKAVGAKTTVCNALAQDGKIEMPLTKTFWSPLYGMLTDKFGIGWMVMVAGPAA